MYSIISNSGEGHGIYTDFVEACEDAVKLKTESGGEYHVYEIEKAWSTELLERNVVFHNFQVVKRRA